MISPDRSVIVFDTDEDDMPYAVKMGEVCSIRFQVGNFATNVRITRAEADELVDQLGAWLRGSEAGL